MPEVGGKVFSFESFTLDLKRGCLRREDREVELRPKSFEVLRYLVENAGRLVSKDELIRAVWPSVIVTDESLTRCVSDARLALGDKGQRIIETVPRRGYLFAAPISLPPERPDREDAIDRIDRRPTGAAAKAEQRETAPLLSIVVLPFANLGGGKEQDYFVDGITESLTTDLSRIRGAFVIACNTAFAYRGRAMDARQIGRELGVRYVMEGSVQSGADRIRVNAQLIDAETGAHLWAERFDKPRADIFDMQDEITARLARLTGIEIVIAEGRRVERERPDNMDSVDLAMRGWATWSRTQTLERTRAARGLFEAALRLDDRNTRALVGLAGTCLHEIFYFAADNPAEQTRIAEAALSKALALEPDSASAHFWHANLLYELRAPERALRECVLAISLDRNYAWAHAFAGAMKTFLGRADETEADVANAIRLSPRDPGLGHWHFYAGAADLFLGRFDHAIDRLRRSIDINPNVGLPCLFLAAGLALVGRAADASEAREAGLRLIPSFNISKFRSEPMSDNPVYLAQREKLLEGMRRAGY
jgi:TolB-like protein